MLFRSFIFDSYSKENKKVKHEINDDHVAEIEFFGMTMNATPVITYSVINLAIYVAFYISNFRPKIIITMINNTFLSVLYIIVSYSIMFYCLPWLLLNLGELYIHFKIYLEQNKIPIIKAYDDI